MTFAKLDDRANEHRKCLLAGAEACWFWACGLMYANRQPSRDGVIPDLALTMLYPAKNPKRIAERLVEVGLWERTEGGYRIHDYHTLNPTREQYEEYLAKARSRSAKNYQSSKEKNESSSPEEQKKNSDSSGVEWSGVRSDSQDLRVAVRRIFEHWQLEHGHPDAKLDKKRIGRIKARLADGFTADQLCEAISAAKLDDWLMGRDPKSKKIYDDLESLIQDVAKVERLLSDAKRGSGTFATAPKSIVFDPSTNSVVG